MPTYYRPNGQVLQLGKKLGGGGEGNIYQIPALPDLVAKIYHQHNPEHKAKLQAMINNPPPNPTATQNHISIAWPKEMILNNKGQCLGFLMPYIDHSGNIELFKLYHPQTRLKEAPYFNWQYLIYTVANLASVIDALHTKGYVIGDLNESNILVSSGAQVTLIDCDSIQVPAGGTVYRCNVGKSEYTPPELQDTIFSQADRRPEHDNFGLAILIFMMLMEGWHPFYGKWVGKGNPPSIEDNIKNNHCPYVPSGASLVRVPPIAPYTSTLPPIVQKLIARCFEQGHNLPINRPTASEWRQALKQASQNLTICQENTQHYYSNHLGDCPWCERREQLNGQDPFPPCTVQPFIIPPPLITPSPPDPQLQVVPPSKPSFVGLRVLQLILVFQLGAFTKIKYLSKHLPPLPLRFIIPGVVALIMLPVIFLLLRTLSLKLGYSTPALAGHSSSVQAVAYSPDGKTLASGSSDNTVKLWEVATSKELVTFKDHSSWVTSVAFSPDGKTLASGSADSTVKIWSVITDKELATLKGHTGGIEAVAFSPDGKTLASGSSDNTVKIWNVTNGNEISTLKGHLSWVTSVAFSPDGKTLASASADATVKIWNVTNGNEISTLKGHSSWVTSVAFSPDGKTLASGSDDKSVKIWDLVNNKELATLKGHDSWVRTIAFSPDGKTLASGSDDKSVKIWEIASGKELTILKGHSSWVTSVAYSPDGKTIATGSDDNTIKVWEIGKGKELTTFKGHSAWVNAITFNSNGKNFTSTNRDGSTKIWELTSGKPLTTTTSKVQFSATTLYSPNGKTFANNKDEIVKVWEVTNGKELATLKGHSSGITSLAFSSDGTFLATGSLDNIVKVWEVTSGKELATLKGHSSGITSLAFSPDGKTLASGSWDNTIKLWEVTSGKELATLKGHSAGVRSVAFSPDGKTLASGSWDNTIKLWDISKTQEVFSTTIAQTLGVTIIAFSPEGKKLVSGHTDGSIQVWEINK
ncbi:MAG: hypothetical protein WCS37_03045 [Chloroflexota bacterium]